MAKYNKGSASAVNYFAFLVSNSFICCTTLSSKAHFFSKQAITADGSLRCSPPKDLDMTMCGAVRGMHYVYILVALEPSQSDGG